MTSTSGQRAKRSDVYTQLQLLFFLLKCDPVILSGQLLVIKRQKEKKPDDDILKEEKAERNNVPKGKDSFLPLKTVKMSLLKLLIQKYHISSDQ